MSTSSERVEPRNVTLYPSDWQTVEAADISGSGVSAALRLIVRQWKQYTQAERALADTMQRRGVLVDPEVEYAAHPAQGAVEGK